MKLDSHNDTTIWNAFREGDKQAYAEIYELYFDVLYSYGKKFLFNESTIEDAIQDLFITLWRTRSNLSNVDNIKYYLFRCLRRDFYRIQEKEKRIDKIEFDQSLLEELYALEEIDFDKDDTEMSKRLGLILKKLPKRQLEAITLRYYENFSISEIASIMCISGKTVRNTLSNSLILLRKQIGLLTFVMILAFVYFL